MKQGQTVIFMGPASEANGHFEQPAIVTRVWNDTCVNVKVLPDSGHNTYDSTSVTVHPDEASAKKFVDSQKEAGNPHWTPVCWPAVL